MKCPICKADIADSLAKCPECGYEFSDKKDKKKKFSLFSLFKKKNTEPETEILPDNDGKKKLSFKVKAILVFIALIIVVVIVAIIINSINASRGVRLTEELSEAIGRSIAVAEKNAKIELVEESAFPAADKLLQRQGAMYLYESSNEVEVDGVSYPEWVIYVSLDEKSDVSKVEYYDFALLEENYKGEKTKAEIDISQIVVDDKRKDVEKLLKIEPSKIEYSEQTVKYCYNYYFVNDDGDQEARAFYIVYDRDNDRVMNTYRLELSEQWAPRYLF